MENISVEISKYPRDLLQQFFPPNQKSTKRVDEEDLDEEDDGLNLGLGLSLGGKFGIDKPHKLGIVRSSSIAGTMPLLGEIERVAGTPVHTLSRTASLPVESEEEWRKRKEMQTLRRMEAKRRRSEKQRVGKTEDKGLKIKGIIKREEECLGMMMSVGSSIPPKVVEVNKGRRKRSTFGSLQGFLTTQTSHGSGESQGGSSSGASELESKTHQGSSSCGEARSPGSCQSQQDRVSQDSGTKGVESTHHQDFGVDTESSSKKLNKKEEGGGMEDMPCVFTIGSGPNGVRKVEGILYRFGKGEEVRIMCVCHGTFFSPADFVKHAGGKDVDHPLRHIVVSPSASTFP